VGYNSNGIGDGKELLEISQQKYFSQIERFYTKYALDVWRHIQYIYIFYVEAS